MVWKGLIKQRMQYRTYSHDGPGHPRHKQIEERVESQTKYGQ